MTQSGPPPQVWNFPHFFFDGFPIFSTRAKIQPIKYNECWVLAWLQKCTPDYLKLSEVSTLCTFYLQKWTGFVLSSGLCGVPNHVYLLWDNAPLV